MMSVTVIVLFCVFVAISASVKVPKERTSSYVGPLPRAYGSPLNVDQDVDCAIKVLAWEYAKKLLPRVSSLQSNNLDNLSRTITTCVNFIWIHIHMNTYTSGDATPTLTCHTCTLGRTNTFYLLLFSDHRVILFLYKRPIE